MEELISIIVPVYNVQDYLKRCIESIMSQTYKNIEVILVNDGSTDNSGNICNEYMKIDGRIQVIHQKNGGLSDARNTGIKRAKGKYITLIDSDDYVTNDYIETLYMILKQNDADMSAVKHLVKYDDGGEINTGSGKEYVLNPEKALDMILCGEDMDVSAWGKLYKKELFDNVKYPEGRLYEDAATTYKLIDLCKKVAFKSEPKYIYYVRKNSITTNAFNPQKMDLIVSTKEMCNYVINKYPYLKQSADRRLMYAYLSTLTQLAKCVNYKDYKIYQIKLIKYIKENRGMVLKNNRLPKRDRIALNCTKLGFNFFRFSWCLYEKITNRR